MTCVYVNPKTHTYWIIDDRLYDVHRDGKTKLQHLLEMLHTAHFVKDLAFRTVLIDAWYASMNVMKAIESLDKVYYAPLKRNRLVSSCVASGYQRVETLTWTETQGTCGQLVLRRAAEAAGQTIYQLKESLLDDYIRQQLQKPLISINIA